MLVVSDTSPVTSLLQIGHGDLLPRLFERVLIPPAVEAELLRFHTSLPGFLKAAAIRDAAAADALVARKLDRGEAEAIVLARECGADYLLIDEKRGRSAAIGLGVKVIGVLGMLLIAKKAGYIGSVAAMMDQLQFQAGFFISTRARLAILRAAGESP